MAFQLRTADAQAGVLERPPDRSTVLQLSGVRKLFDGRPVVEELDLSIGVASSSRTRPEDAELVIGRATLDDRVLPAVTRSALFLGDRYQVQVELATGAQLPLHAPRTAQSNWSPDASVGVRVDPEAMMVWPV